jgi:hypothetical protein
MGHIEYMNKNPDPWAKHVKLKTHQALAKDSLWAHKKTSKVIADLDCRYQYADGALILCVFVTAVTI